MIEKLIMRHEFVETFPEVIEEGCIYISIPFATAVHHCCCGCKSEVVTPLSPSQWSLTYDGKSISLYPSIGNWSLPCQSHYWIKNSNIIWARSWSLREIEKNRKINLEARAEYYSNQNSKKKSSKTRRKALWQHWKAGD